MDKKVSIIAKSESMNNILGTIDGMKDSDCNVLLTGETGVGKSLLAKIIHFTSRRQGMPFLSINCATLTEELLASELFGHEKGAFTGAVKTKQGLVEIADTGTLFLDEIAEMAPNLQAKLLKVIEEGEFYRVGGTRPIKVDVRFIAATNQNVRTIIAEGQVPRGPVLPPEHHGDLHPAAPRPPGRHPAALHLFPGKASSELPQEDHGLHERGA